MKSTIHDHLSLQTMSASDIGPMLLMKIDTFTSVGRSAIMVIMVMVLVVVMMVMLMVVMLSIIQI